MPSPQHQILMGVSVSCACLAGLIRQRWLLANTSKGQRLVRWCGEPTARYVWGLICVAGIVFGSLLATDVIRPMNW